MKFELLISDEAILDIEDALIWYENQKQGLGILFEEQLEHAFHFIGSDPFICQVRYKKVRIFFLKKFPYGIHFITKDNFIYVIAVFHCAQNPKSWKKRLKG